jgi:hypothetical protein
VLVQVRATGLCEWGPGGGEGAGDILSASHREAPCVIHSAAAGVHAFLAHARGEHSVDANATLPMCVNSV